MSKAEEKALMRAMFAKMEKLFLLLDPDVKVLSGMSIEEVEKDLLGMGIDPERPLPAAISRLIPEAVGARLPPPGYVAAGQALPDALRELRGRWPFQVYVSDDPLLDECTGEVKRLILKTRYLTRCGRYEEALSLAAEALRLEPNYWRARVSYATLSALFGHVDEAERTFEQLSEEFPDNPKAVAAGLHGRGWVKEMRYALDPLEEALGEALSFYSEALRLDASRANTRACLLNLMFTPGREDNGGALLEESLQSEGFLEQMELELTARLDRREAETAPGSIFKAEAFDKIARRARSALNLLQKVAGNWFPSSLVHAHGFAY